MRFSTILKAALGLAILTLAACSPTGPGTELTTAPVEDGGPSAQASTPRALPTERETPQETETFTPAPSVTEEPTAVPSQTPTARPPQISVSLETNCRSGPDPSFEFLGVLSPGEKAEVVAKSSTEDYWYIVNPDDPSSQCWLWDEYATIEGETGSLPVRTPVATPTPQVGFDVWFHGFASCGSSQLAIFAIRNGGAVRLWSGWIGAYTVGTSEKLYGPILDRHPFSETATETCPPGHGNELFPGEVNYILVPLKSTPAETDAYVEFKLCSADHGRGDCVTKIGYFYIP